MSLSFIGLPPAGLKDAIRCFSCRAEKKIVWRSFTDSSISCRDGALNQHMSAQYFSPTANVRAPTSLR